MILWESCKEDFKWDGSLRDIYVAPATLKEWQSVHSLVSKMPGAEFLVDGVTHPLPFSVEQIFEIRPSTSPTLRIVAGRALVVFHFFCEEEIEADVDPREITSQLDLDALLAFIQKLGDATHKCANLTPENQPDKPFLIYDPTTAQFEYRDATKKG